MSGKMKIDVTIARHSDNIFLFCFIINEVVVLFALFFSITWYHIWFIQQSLWKKLHLKGNTIDYNVWRRWSESTGGECVPRLILLSLNISVTFLRFTSPVHNSLSLWRPSDHRIHCHRRRHAVFFKWPTIELQK